MGSEPAVGAPVLPPVLMLLGRERLATRSAEAHFTDANPKARVLHQLLRQGRQEEDNGDVSGAQGDLMGNPSTVSSTPQTAQPLPGPLLYKCPAIRPTPTISGLCLDPPTAPRPHPRPPGLHSSSPAFNGIRLEPGSASVSPEEEGPWAPRPRSRVRSAPGTRWPADSGQAWLARLGALVLATPYPAMSAGVSEAISGHPLSPVAMAQGADRLPGSICKALS